MASRWFIAGFIVLLVLFAFAAGCTFRTSDGTPAPTLPPATGTPSPVTPATPVSTGAGGGEDGIPEPTVTIGRISPTATATTIAVTAAPTETPATPSATPTPVPDGIAAISETTVAGTVASVPVPTGTVTIAELASADPELTRFVQALRQGGVYEMLNGTGTYTVFAPDDTAFDAVPPGTLTRLLFDHDALDAVANYHVVYGRWLAADLAGESSVATRSGVPLAVTILPDGGVQVDDARVTRADIVATNGVLHVVDRVMIPPGTI